MYFLCNHGLDLAADVHQLKGSRVVWSIGPCNALFDIFEHYVGDVESEVERYKTAICDSL